MEENTEKPLRGIMYGGTMMLKKRDKANCVSVPMLQS